MRFESAQSISRRMARLERALAVQDKTLIEQLHRELDERMRQHPVSLWSPALVLAVVRLLEVVEADERKPILTLVWNQAR